MSKVILNISIVPNVRKGGSPVRAVDGESVGRAYIRGPESNTKRLSFVGQSSMSKRTVNAERRFALRWKQGHEQPSSRRRLCVCPVHFGREKIHAAGAASGERREQAEAQPPSHEGVPHDPPTCY